MDKQAIKFDCIKRSTWQENTDLLFDMFRFEIYQFSSSLQSGSRFRTVVISVQAKVVDLLSLQVSHLHGAERIANTADDNVPKSFGRSFIDTFCIDNVS